MLCWKPQPRLMDTGCTRFIFYLSVMWSHQLCVLLHLHVTTFLWEQSSPAWPHRTVPSYYTSLKKLVEHRCCCEHCGTRRGNISSPSAYIASAEPSYSHGIGFVISLAALFRYSEFPAFLRWRYGRFCTGIFEFSDIVFIEMLRSFCWPLQLWAWPCSQKPKASHQLCQPSKFGSSSKTSDWWNPCPRN